MQLVCLHSPTMGHFSHLFPSFSICVSLCVNSAMANCYILPVYSFTCVSFLPSHLILSYLPLVCLSLSFFLFSTSLLLSTPLIFSSFIFFTSPSLYISPLLLFPFLLPLFRLCKVQLGFGAFGLQAWRQEDALSEYALLGSLCVTLYFFALLFLPVIFT